MTFKTLFLLCLLTINAQASIYWEPVDTKSELTLRVDLRVLLDFKGGIWQMKMAKAIGSSEFQLMAADDMSCQPGLISTEIGPNAKFESKELLCGLLTHDGEATLWWNQGAQYLGFKHGEHYGWLKVELKNDAWHILEYAYEECKGAAILSGAKSGGAICSSVVAIERVTSNLTNLNQLDFRVRFDEAVIGVDVMDFILNATVNNASIIKLIGSNDIYTVTVNTGTGDGNLQLNLIDNGTISNGNLPLKASFTEGEIYNIDKTPPNTTINSKPPTSNNKKDAHFEFSADEAFSYECKLDLANFDICNQSIDYYNLNYGLHKFEVRAIDKAGNVDLTPASYEWNIVTPPPPPKKPDIIIDDGKVVGKVEGDKDSPVVLNNVEVLESAEVSNVIISGTIKNAGIIKDVSLDADTRIEGGKVAAKIEGDKDSPAILNHVEVQKSAQLSNVILEQNVILPSDITLIDVELRGASVNGGRLEGKIRVTGSATVIKNVILAKNTSIAGGRLAGKIQGDKDSPAVLQHLVVEPKSQLTNVIIADGVEIPKNINLGIGVRFTTIENIPTGVDLTNTLPKIDSNIDLSADPVVNGKGILAAINRIPEFVASKLTIKQHDTGYVYLDIEGIRYAVNPLQVQATSKSANLQLSIGQTVYFQTSTNIEILAQPAVQAPAALETALSNLNLPTVRITEAGNIQVPATEKMWYSGRPDLVSKVIDQENSIGLINKDNLVALIFEDELGQKREQTLYPAPANMSVLLEVADADDILQGRLDYQVIQGDKPSNPEIEIRKNNDNFLIIYPDGTQQKGSYYE
ncbi:hypothetical protein [Candidatus Marithrix sp. Canyon 246]|uniref:hypothetical protein n=1 Tax=Candidatus Marithrix sp. Canyon 246 TaxID=1827136 RepID=UPI00084A10E3|nr:hypothetical protein [Candidatus Marithrix sp. Canyon 246]